MFRFTTSNKPKNTMINNINALKMTANKPWSEMSETEQIRYGAYNRIDASRSMRNLVKRTYEKEYERWKQNQADIMDTIDLVEDDFAGKVAEA